MSNAYVMGYKDGVVDITDEIKQLLFAYSDDGIKTDIDKMESAIDELVNHLMGQK